MKIVRLGVLAFLGALTTGCASTCLIDSDPRGATITVDGKEIGKTPVTFGFSTSGFRDTYRVEASKEGYESELRLVQPTTDVWGTTTWPGQVFFRLRRPENR